MVEYIPIIIGFFISIVGILGKSWDEEKIGIKRLKIKGWIIIFLLTCSFIYTTWIFKIKNDKEKEINDVAWVAHQRIIRGLNYILSVDLNNEDIINSLKDTTYLFGVVGMKKMFAKKDDSWGFKSVTIYRSRKGSDYLHPYEGFIDDAQYGEKIIKESILLFKNFLDYKSLTLIETILNDNYYCTIYKLNLKNEIESNKKKYMGSNTHSTPAINYLGYYYFNTDYSKPNNMSTYLDFIKFILKIENYINHVKKSINIYDIFFYGYTLYYPHNHRLEMFIDRNFDFEKYEYENYILPFLGDTLDADD